MRLVSRPRREWERRWENGSGWMGFDAERQPWLASLRNSGQQQRGKQKERKWKAVSAR